jgi:hypothetical protein
MEITMKTLVTAVALAVVIASPAMAQKKSRAAAEKSFALSQPQDDAMQAFAWSAQPAQPRRSLNPAYDVYVNGTYIGSDPDPQVREGLRRDSFSDY